MTLTDYLGVLRKQWYIVLLLAAVSLAGAAAYTFTAVPEYSASAQLFVSFDSSDTSAADLQSGSTFTQQRVKSYTQLIGSPAVLTNVKRNLGLTESITAIEKEITAETPLDTTLIAVTVTDESPALAARIANTFSTVFANYIEVIETPKRAGATSPVSVIVTKPAVAPLAPVSPRIPLNLALGLVLGLVLGIAAAVLREQTNTSIGGTRDIEKLTNAVPLGVVPFDKSTTRQPLVQGGDQAGRSEAFRTLRTNLQFTNVDDPPRTIVVTSALPDEGKSTTACNIAMSLAVSGASVALIEADLRKPALSKYLGVSAGAGLTNVLAGQYDLREVLVPYGQQNLAVLPSGPKPPNPSELLGSAHMMSVLETLSTHFDYVIIDAPPLLPVTDGAVVAALTDGALLVVRHGKTTRENVDRAMQSLKAVNARLLGTVLNFAPRSKRGGGYDGYGYGYGYGAPVADDTSWQSASRIKPANGGLASIRSTAPPPANGYPAPVDETSALELNGANGTHAPVHSREGRR